MVTHCYCHSHFVEQVLGLVKGKLFLEVKPPFSMGGGGGGGLGFLSQGQVRVGREQDSSCLLACVQCLFHEG